MIQTSLVGFLALAEAAPFAYNIALGAFLVCYATTPFLWRWKGVRGLDSSFVLFRSNDALMSALVAAGCGFLFG